MTILQLTPDDVEAIHYLILSGKSPVEVAIDLGISPEMVICAERKWAHLPAFDYAGFAIRHL